MISKKNDFISKMYENFLYNGRYDSLVSQNTKNIYFNQGKEDYLIFYLKVMRKTILIKKREK